MCLLINVCLLPSNSNSSTGWSSTLYVYEYNTVRSYVYNRILTDHHHHWPGTRQCRINTHNHPHMTRVTAEISYAQTMVDYSNRSLDFKVQGINILFTCYFKELNSLVQNNCIYIAWCYHNSMKFSKTLDTHTLVWVPSRWFKTHQTKRQDRY